MLDTSSQTAASLNKDEMAAVLKCSLPTLNKLMRKHGDQFPVLRAGSNGRAYAFDPAAVTDFLQQVEAAHIAEGRAKDELMQQYTLPDIAPPAEPALSARERLDLARLRQIERDELIKAGFLVETSRARAALVTVVTALRRDMNSAIRQSLRDANVPEAVIRSIDGRVGNAQRNFVKSVQQALRKPAEGAGNGVQTALL